MKRPFKTSRKTTEATDCFWYTNFLESVSNRGTTQSSRAEVFSDMERMPIAVRKLSTEDLPSLSKYLGRTVTELFGDTLIALDHNGTVIGVLSFSRIYSTWENRSMAVNSASTSSADVLKQLLVALAKTAAEENCSRIDTQTSDPQLAATLTELGAQDLTVNEDWNSFQLKHLEEFVSK